MDATEARARFASAPVARLATVAENGRPHLVPGVFALDGDTLYTAVDDVKPKATTRLGRLANIAADPAVGLPADPGEPRGRAARRPLRGRLERAVVGPRRRHGAAARPGRRGGGAAARAAGRALSAVPGGAPARRRDRRGRRAMVGMVRRGVSARRRGALTPTCRA